VNLGSLQSYNYCGPWYGLNRFSAMFRKWTPADHVSGLSQCKSSVARNIRKRITQLYPSLDDQMEFLLPKKGAVYLAKCKDHIQLVVSKGEALFFCIRNGDWLPTLRTLHKYPDILPTVQVDTGAIKFVLSGVNIFCPGLTSPGGNLDIKVDKEKYVAVMAENKKHACAVGLTKMSTEDMRKINKGIAVENIHQIGDGLWVNYKIGKAEEQSGSESD